MSNLPDGTWGYTRLGSNCCKLWQVNDAKEVVVGIIDNEASADFIVEKLNAQPPELIAGLEQNRSTT